MLEGKACDPLRDPHEPPDPGNHAIRCQERRHMAMVVLYSARKVRFEYEKDLKLPQKWSKEGGKGGTGKVRPQASGCSDKSGKYDRQDHRTWWRNLMTTKESDLGAISWIIGIGVVDLASIVVVSNELVLVKRPTSQIYGPLSNFRMRA